MVTPTWRSVVLFLGETVMLALAVEVGGYLRVTDGTWNGLADTDGTLRVLLIVVVCQLCLYYADLYDRQTIADPRDLLLRLFQALGATSLILGAIYFWLPEWMIGRGVFLLAVALIITLVMAWRLLFVWLTKHAVASERLLLVGTSPACVKLARELFNGRHELGVEIVGFVDPDPSRVGAPVLNPGVIGTIDDIPSLVSRLNVDRVVVSLSEERGRLPMDRLLDIRLQKGVSFAHLASVYEEYTGKIAVENLRPSWLIFARGFHKTRASMSVKRTFDLVVSLAGLAIGLPAMLIIALLVKMTSRGPALYHQERVGLNGRTFSIHKFRSMRQDAEVKSGPVWSVRHDARVTPIGRFLRRSRLDELPQLWNVFRGEMSFVGPRPERPTFVEELTAKIPFYCQRHVLKPGLTGWAQIRYTYGASVEDATEKLQYDLYYIKNLSFALDLVIVLETIKTVLLGRGAQ